MTPFSVFVFRFYLTTSGLSIWAASKMWKDGFLASILMSNLSIGLAFIMAGYAFRLLRTDNQKPQVSLKFISRSRRCKVVHILEIYFHGLLFTQLRFEDSIKVTDRKAKVVLIGHSHKNQTRTHPYMGKIDVNDVCWWLWDVGEIIEKVSVEIDTHGESLINITEKANVMILPPTS